MSEQTSTHSPKNFAASFEKNVGVHGGDLPTRVVAGAVILAFAILSVPPFGVSYSALKIAALLSAQLGAIFLMMGLFFSRTTYFAAIMLIPAPLIMLWLVGNGFGWLASVVGLLLLIAGLQNMVTRKCAVNRLLHVNSRQTA